MTLVFQLLKILFEGDTEVKRHWLRFWPVQAAAALQQCGSLGGRLLVWLLLGSGGEDWQGQGTVDTAGAVQQVSVYLVESFKT